MMKVISFPWQIDLPTRRHLQKMVKEYRAFDLERSSPSRWLLLLPQEVKDQESGTGHQQQGSNTNPGRSSKKQSCP